MLGFSFPDSPCIFDNKNSNEVDETGAYLQSEVSQKEKHKYSILTHIYGI